MNVYRGSYYNNNISLRSMGERLLQKLNLSQWKIKGGDTIEYDYLYPIKLDTTDEVAEFVHTVSQVKPDVRLIGYDENGQEWELSAKSELCSTIMELILKNKKKFTSNQLWCSCSSNIHSHIRKFI